MHRNLLNYLNWYCLSIAKCVRPTPSNTRTYDFIIKLAPDELLKSESSFMWMICLSVCLSVCPGDIFRTLWNFGTKLGGNILWVNSKVEFGDGHPGSKGTGIIPKNSLKFWVNSVKRGQTVRESDLRLSQRSVPGSIPRTSGEIFCKFWNGRNRKTFGHFGVTWQSEFHSFDTRDLGGNLTETTGWTWSLGVESPARV